MSNLSLPLLLRAPVPTQSSLSFCDATPKDLKRWIATLPKANLGEMARQLYQGLGELNQLLTPSENRLQLLELLRPEVAFVCKHLERHFLNQSVVLEERPRKVANLCQALQNHLAVGYKQIIVRVAPKLSRDRTALLTTALQRALHCLNGPLIRANQLYCPVQDGLWMELHQIYQIARQHQLHAIPVPDNQAHHTRTLTVEQTYIVALLMGCSRCNQMRQHNIGKLADALDAWSAMVTLQQPFDESSLYAVAFASDTAPRYTSLFSDDQRSQLLGFNPRPLSAALERYIETPPEQRSQSYLHVPPGLSIDVLQHLAAAWGDVSERAFQRTPGQGTLTVCVGMSALHYFVGGQRCFSDLLQVDHAAVGRMTEYTLQPLESARHDPWGQAMDVQRASSSSTMLPFEEIEYQGSDAEAAAAADGQKSFPTYSLNIVNHSPGGYCLAWPKDVPDQLQAGEMIGIQDHGHGWSIAVVRWVRQVRSGGTQMGVELIAPFAQACGMQLLRTEQSSQYLRALLLPEVRAIDVPATVLAPRLPFDNGNKVMINNCGEERPATLNGRKATTGNYNQFEYEMLEGPKITTEQSGPEQEFDSLWTVL
ncbi:MULTISPECIES: molecular chaperone [unclassified Pseudomonas]|uniref:molecular chaperone n=1 Tax=unclassified Pseudomonas TaxID=196821 RepID=UPI000D34B8B2|nr:MULTISPECIES: molecular chaperone [unclassified Pseudomonas]RAU43080.1 molecular chaperone [Pseudomonas sp. RIT 409]RAU53370.1 molecular chaperone [Pseudomonas sp. RIT 412]